MKKLFALFAFVGLLCSVSAQKVNETVTVYGNDQLTGFTINIDNATADIVAAALADKFESQFAMKGANKKGFRVYENQPCPAFGEARYDTYFTTSTVGKKKSQYTQLILVVSTGNMNCITFSNDPRTARSIVMFMENLPNDVEAYKTQLRIKQLETELANLKRERESLEKDQEKVNEKLKMTNDDIKKISDRLDRQAEEIEKLQDQFNKTHDPKLRDQIATAVKDKEAMQKSHNAKQKSLLKMNDELYKINNKLQENAKKIEEIEAELKTLR